MTAKNWSFFGWKTADKVVRSNAETKSTQIDLDAKVPQAERPAKKSSWCDCVTQLCGERPARRQTVSSDVKSPTAHTTLVSTPRTPPRGTMQTPVEPIYNLGGDNKDTPSGVTPTTEMAEVKRDFPSHPMPGSNPVMIDLNSRHVGEDREQKTLNDSYSKTRKIFLHVFKIVLTFGFLGSILGTILALRSEESTKSQVYKSTLWGLFGGTCVGALSFASKLVRRLIELLTTHSPVPITGQGMLIALKGGWRKPGGKLVSATTSPFIVAMVFFANIAEVLRRAMRRKASKNFSHDRSNSESKSQLSANQALPRSSEIATNQNQTRSVWDKFRGILPTFLISGCLIAAGAFGWLRAEGSFLYYRLSQFALYLGITFLTRIFPTEHLKRCLHYFRRHKNSIRNILAFLASISVTGWGQTAGLILIPLAGFVLIADGISRKMQNKKRKEAFGKLVDLLIADPEFVRELKKFISYLKQAINHTDLGQAGNQQKPSCSERFWEKIEKCWEKILSYLTRKNIFRSLLLLVPAGYVFDGFPGLAQFAVFYSGLLTFFGWSKLRNPPSLNTESMCKLLSFFRYLAEESMTPIVVALAYYVNNWWAPLFNGLDENSTVPDETSFGYALVEYLLFSVSSALLFAWLYSPRKWEKFPEKVIIQYNNFLSDLSGGFHRSTVSIQLLEEISSLPEEKSNQGVTQVVVTPRHAQQQGQQPLTKKVYESSFPIKQGNKLYGQIMCKQGFFEGRMTIKVVPHSIAVKKDSSPGKGFIAIALGGDVGTGLGLTPAI